MDLDSLHRLDLNLLVTLDVLLRERNVTRAASRLGVTQPSMSSHLARLRRHFDDELLLRVGRHYELTPLAAHLLGHTTEAITAVQRVFEARSAFHPAASEREFRFLVTDYTALVLGPRLGAQVAAQAPHVRLRLDRADPGSTSSTGDPLRTVDGAVLPGPHTFPHAASVTLWQDTWVLAVPGDPAPAAATASVEELRQRSWVMVHDQAMGSSPAAQILTRLGVTPRVGIVVDSMAAAVLILRATDRVALLPRRALSTLGGEGIATLGLPRPVPPLTVGLHWHSVDESDPGHRWFRSQIQSCLEEEPVAAGGGRPGAGSTESAQGGHKARKVAHGNL